MATAEELLRNSVLQPDPEGHIVVGGDRFITVPSNLKRLGVQYDHNMETVVFDCPRYWDERDMSKMAVYINYALSDGYMDRYPADNVTADGDVMHFEWTISRNVTQVAGVVSFLICVMKTDSEGNEERHWNSELCQDCYISPGMETEESPVDSYPDLVTQLLLRMDSVEQINVQADEMRTLYDNTVAVAATAEEVKNEALDASDYIKNSYANAIKGSASGEIIRVDDVSPIEHDVKCLVHGKNLFDISKITNTDLITNNGDGTLTVAAGAYYARLTQKLSTLCPGLRVGDVATFNMITDSSYSRYMYLHGLGRTWNIGAAETMTQEILDSYVCFYGYTESDPLYGTENVLSNIQIEKSVAATEYKPYIDPSTVTMTRCGKNLLDIDGMRNSFLTKSGDVYTFKKGNNAGDRFTNVVPVYIPANTELCISAIFDDYTVTDGTLYMIFTYTDGTQAFPGIVFKEKYRYIRLQKDLVSIQFYIQGTQAAGSYIAFRKIQLEIGTVPTVYEPYTKDETAIDANGICSVISASPNMTLFTDTPGAIIEAEYNVDTMKFLNANIVTDRIEAAVSDCLSKNPIAIDPLMLTDTNTGKKYQLVVTNGKLTMMEVL